VSDEKHDSPRPFDVKTVEYLLRLMSEHSLSEIDLTEADQRIRLRKVAPRLAPIAPAPVFQPVAGPVVGPVPAASAPVTVASKYLEIKSELIGTFYTRPLPDKPEFVKVGSRVTPETTVCLVVAMKVNNEIKARVSGTIVEVVAKNEDFVDFNTVLFRVDPS